jgi:hypothetical protein
MVSRVIGLAPKTKGHADRGEVTGGPVQVDGLRSGIKKKRLDFVELFIRWNEEGRSGQADHRDAVKLEPRAFKAPLHTHLVLDCHGSGATVGLE